MFSFRPFSFTLALFTDFEQKKAILDEGGNPEIVDKTEEVGEENEESINVSDCVVEEPTLSGYSEYRGVERRSSAECRIS